MTFLTTLQLGKQYMATWPMLLSLASYFPENRVIMFTTLGLKLAPWMALIYISIISLLMPTALPMAIAVGLFIISLPLQGLFWLGDRAQKPLPLSLLRWYQEIVTTLDQLEVAYSKAQLSPNYLGLAKVLAIAAKSMPKPSFDKLMFQ